MDRFIQVCSPKLGVMPGEDDELVNDGIYGKATALFLKERLPKRGIPTGKVVCEDWGWWLELLNGPFSCGVCIYGIVDDDGGLAVAVTDSAGGRKQWSWHRLRFIDPGPWADNLHAHLLAVFRRDPEIELVRLTDDPFSCSEHGH